LRAKFISDSNFSLREVGGRRGVLECRLKIAEVYYEEMEGGDGDRRPVCTYFGKMILRGYLVYLLASLSWQEISH